MKSVQSKFTATAFKLHSKQAYYYTRFILLSLIHLVVRYTRFIPTGVGIYFHCLIKGTFVQVGVASIAYLILKPAVWDLDVIFQITQNSGRRNEIQEILGRINYTIIVVILLPSLLLRRPPQLYTSNVAGLNFM